MKSEEQDKSDIVNDINAEAEKEMWIITEDGEKKWIRKCPTCNCNVYHILKPRKRQLLLDCLSCGQKKRDEKIRKTHSINDFKRNCPKCNIQIEYTKIGNRNIAEKKKRLCKFCLWEKSRIYKTPNILKRYCPNCNKIIEYKGKTLTRRRISYLRAEKEKRMCKNCTSSIKNPMKGIRRCGSENPNYGKRWDSNQRKNARIREIKNFINRGYIFNNYNPKACEYFDKLNKENDWNLRHALNGGEINCIGYFLDAYDKEKNIVVEYDEFHHYDSLGNLKEKDILRMKEIINHLHCKFYRYNDQTKIITETGKMA